MEFPFSKDHATIPEFLIGGGELGHRIREYDWSKTPLGPVKSWPRSLRTCVQIMLTSRQPIWIGWGKELIKLYNDPYKAIAGGKHPWAVGKPASVVWKDIWKDIEPMLHKVMVEKEGTYVESQLLIMERNGYPEETYYTFSYTPIAGDGGEIEGMFCVNTDDTDRIISERQLRTLTQLGKSLIDNKTNEEAFRQTFNTLKSNPYDFPFALIYRLNGSALELVHSSSEWKPRDSIPQTIDLSSENEISTICADALRSKRKQVLNDVRARFGDMPSGFWGVSPDQLLFLPISQSRNMSAYGLLVVGLNPFRLLDEAYAGFFELIADQVATSLANIHAMEIERKRLETLAELDRAKTTFFSNISHEFRTPLTLLLGPLEDLLADPEIKDENREKADVALRNAMRMQKLVNLLLDFSRIEAGRMEAELTPVNILTLTADYASNFRSVIEKAGMKLILDFEPVEELVLLDVDMWEKVMLNLISNAFKYSEEGTITVSIRKANDAVEVSVADTGVGIPESEVSRIFERFYRVQNVKGRSQEGTGIGLAMVRELVKLHGGTIAVKSRPGEGSTFTVSLPLGNASPFRSVPKERPSAKSVQSAAYIEEAQHWIPKEARRDFQSNDDSSATPASTPRKHKVLLADDNADMRIFVERLLEKDYNVLTVSDGEEAFNAAKQFGPDLILTDIMMPGMDGFQLLQKLRANLSTRNIPVLFLSARAGEESKVEGLNAGADDYLIKPFSSKELLARIASHIAISMARRKTEKEFFNLFLQSPAHIHVMKGPDHVVEFFHPLGIPFVGRDITGMRIRDAVPILEGQGLFELLDKVYHEGTPVHVNESKATFRNEKGEPVDHYFNLTYLPWKDFDNKTQGVLQFSFEVTETVKLRLKAEANEGRFRSIARQAPVAMALLRGPDHVIEIANDRMLQLWGRKEIDVIGSAVVNVFPEISEQGIPAILKKVYDSGEPFFANEMPIILRNGESYRKLFVNLLYEPFRDGDDAIEGILAVAYDVTDQVQARNRVAEAELKFRTIIEQTPSPLCIFKGEEMVLEVANEAALLVWQAGPEVIGKRLSEIVPEMQRQVFLELMSDVYKNGVTRYGYEAPAYFVRKNGEKENRFFNFIYVPFYDVDRTIVGVLVLATDVTEQVVAKKQLIDNEERLRIASEILELGTWEFDPVNDLVYLSGKSVELLGLEDIVPIRLNDLVEVIDEKDREKVVTGIRAALDGYTDGRVDMEFSIVTGQKRRPRIVRSIAQGFFDSNKTATRLIGTLLDITERKKAEEKIISSEARFRILTTSIPQIVWTSDKEGNSTYLSVQFERYTGMKPEEGLTAWTAVLHPEDAERVLARRRDVFQKGEPWQDEFRLRNLKTGTYRWFMANATPLKDTNGDVAMYIGAASDIQDLKEQSVWLEKQVQERTRSLKELNQSLKASNEDLQQFAHVASHDLKEPVRKIKTFSNRLKDEFASVLPPNASVFLSKILSASDRMYAMIEGVLSYSTVTSNDSTFEPVDLNLILRDIQNDLEVLINEKDATIEISTLPVIQGSHVLLYQLFYNLLNNALKFSKKEEPPKISIHSALLYIDHGKFEKITLKDNGIGFDQDDADRIFSTFTRLNSKDKYEGTGLGLALCKKIVQRHHGTISAKGQKGTGAEFTILLPRS